jgi:hypothetical protein
MRFALEYASRIFFDFDLNFATIILMKIYQSKCACLPSRSYAELVKIARKIYHEIEKQTNRTPYIRTNKSSYFKGRKVFVNLFFTHLNQKSQFDRRRRLKFFAAGLDLVKHSTYAPVTKPNPNKSSDTLLRFAGATKDGELFYVQVRKNSRGNHYLMSIFPPE